MDESVSWIAVAMAGVSLVGNLIAAVNARLLARDKLELERQTARDKLEFDAKLTATTAALAGCEEQHAKSQKDRDSIHARLAASEASAAQLREQIKALTDQLRETAMDAAKRGGIVDELRNQLAQLRAMNQSTP